jgi:hypothetical protein
MLAMGIDRSRANNGYRTNYNSRGEVEWDGGIASGRKVDSSHVLARRGSGNSSAIDDAGTTDKYSKPASAALNKKSPEDSSTLGVSSNQSNTKTNSNSGSSGGGGDSALLDIDKFNAISSLMPFVSHVFDRQRQSADGKTQVIPAIHVCYASISVYEFVGLTHISHNVLIGDYICTRGLYSGPDVTQQTIFRNG